MPPTPRTRRPPQTTAELFSTARESLPSAPSAEPTIESSEDEGLSKMRPNPKVSDIAIQDDDGPDDVKEEDERIEDGEESSEEYDVDTQCFIDEDYGPEEQATDDSRAAQDQNWRPRGKAPVAASSAPGSTAKTFAKNTPGPKAAVAKISETENPTAKLPAKGTPIESRTSKSDKVLCVCGHSERALKVGRCSDCNLLIHPACRARTSKDLPGFLCFQCPGERLKTFRLTGDIQYIVTVDGQSAQAIKREKPKKVEKQDKAEITVDEPIVCNCPSRAMKLRARLGRCSSCDQIVHISCKANKPPDNKPGYACGACQKGWLEEIPDRIISKTAARKIAKNQLLPAQTHRQEEVEEHAPAAKRRKIAHPDPVRLQQTPRPDEALPIDITDQELPKRRILRQRSTPVLKDLLSRSQRKDQKNLTDPEISKQFETMYNSLIRKAKKAEKEPRTSNIHDIFLRDIPLDLLWRYYCLLPENATTNAFVRAATKVHFVDYRVEPIAAVPSGWKEELKHRIRLLLDAAKTDGQSVRLKERMWKLDAGIALRHLRDMAVEALHQGSLRVKNGRARLGLLGEMLGLSAKGTFWKGIEEFRGD